MQADLFELLQQTLLGMIALLALLHAADSNLLPSVWLCSVQLGTDTGVLRA